MNLERIPNFSLASVLVIGDLMLDRYLTGSSSRISPEAPVPVLKVEQQTEQPGGAANVALNLAMLGCHVSLTGICGRDRACSIMTSKLTAAGVHFMPVTPDLASTVIKQRMICQGQQMLRVDFEQEHEDATSDLITVLEDHIDDARLLVLSDYDKGCLAHAEALIDIASDRDTPVFVDPKGNDFSRYRGASLLTPNIHEFERIVGHCTTEQDIIDRGMAMIDRLQLDALLITRGDKGMTLLARDKVCNHTELHIPALANEVYDVTGAGDTVVATMAGACAAGWTMDEAAYLANMAASLVVVKTGTASITSEELRLKTISRKRPDNGVVNEDQLLSLIDESRRLGETLVMTNGCFDVIHAGHVHYLEQAKKIGDRLIVLVNDDDSVTRIKGKHRPVNRLDRRMSVLAGLGAVDWVTWFNDDDPKRLIELTQPDILVKGGDYKRIEDVVGYDIVMSYGGRVQLLDQVSDLSTSSIIQLIENNTNR